MKCYGLNVFDDICQCGVRMYDGQGCHISIITYISETSLLFMHKKYRIYFNYISTFETNKKKSILEINKYSLMVNYSYPLCREIRLDR